MKYIGEEAFRSCKSIKDVAIPASVDSIAKWAFMDCDDLKKITLEHSDKAIAFMSDPFNDLILDSLILNRVVPSIGYAKPKHIIFGEGWEIIPKQFISSSSNNLTLTTVKLPESIKRIEQSVFYNCDSLTSINFPNGLTHIGNSAFESCEKLTNPIFGNSLKYIGEEAFRSCNSIEDVVIPASVDSIAKWAFMYCDNLKKITL